MNVRDLFIIMLLVGLAMMFVSFAHGSPGCLTLEEAREEYGSKWLYWHTEHRCWDDKKKNVRDWPHKEPKRLGSSGELRGVSPIPTSQGAVQQEPSSIWPEPPTDAAFSYRWPDQDPIPSPLRWYIFYGAYPP